MIGNIQRKCSKREIPKLEVAEIALELNCWGWKWEEAFLYCKAKSLYGKTPFCRSACMLSYFSNTSLRNLLRGEKSNTRGCITDSCAHMLRPSCSFCWPLPSAHQSHTHNHFLLDNFLSVYTCNIKSYCNPKHGMAA